VFGFAERVMQGRWVLYGKERVIRTRARRGD